MNAPNEKTELSPTPWLKSKSKIYINLLVIGLAWMFLFTAFQSMSNLQSSLNSDAGLGTASLSTIYVTLVVSCLFVPPAMIQRLGLKWSIVIAQCTYVLYIAANMYPKWYILLPAAAILGIGAGPLWTAKCTYLTEIGRAYSFITGETTEAVVNRFFGIFFAMFQTTQIFGNIISSTILKPEVDSNKTTLSVASLNCGVRDYLSSSNGTENIKKPLLSTVYTLCGIYVGLALLGIVTIVLFLSTYKRDGDEKKGISLSVVISTLSHMKNVNQILILPLTIWIGFEQGFINADFTKSFVACAMGINHVGYVMICFGVVNVLCSYLYGSIVKYTGRIPCFISGAVVNYAMIFVMLFWEVNMDQKYVLYIISACWGLADAAWQTQINSIYGVLFQSNEEAAFANFRLWESIGFAVAYAYSNYLRISVKLYLLLAYLSFGMLCYALIEIRERKHKVQQAQIEPAQLNSPGIRRKLQDNI